MIRRLHVSLLEATSACPRSLPRNCDCIRLAAAGTSRSRCRVPSPGETPVCTCGTSGCSGTRFVAHHQFPFATSTSSRWRPRSRSRCTTTPRSPTSSHSVLPVLGNVRTFNLLVLASGVLAAYAMFLFARRTVADDAAAWIAGLTFGFSTFMTARTIEHFSLVQTAPLVLFAYVFDRLRSSAPDSRPGRGTRCERRDGLSLRSFICRVLRADGCVRDRIFRGGDSRPHVSPGSPPYCSTARSWCLRGSC